MLTTVSLWDVFVDLEPAWQLGFVAVLTVCVLLFLFLVWELVGIYRDARGSRVLWPDGRRERMPDAWSPDGDQYRQERASELRSIQVHRVFERARAPRGVAAAAGLTRDRKTIAPVIRFPGGLAS